ncbi:MAG: hypothetical protein ACTSYW_00510 [Candidatus Heimdallarchaeota archaeon]
MKITERMLNFVIEHLNKITMPRHGVDSYELSFAYGGVCLHRRINGGGVEDVFSCGHIPKRKLFELIKAYIAGIQAFNALSDKEKK